MARSAILVEDDRGGLHMAVAHNGRCIEAASNLEMAAPGRTPVFPGLATVVSLYGLFGGRVTRCHFVRSGMSS